MAGTTRALVNNMVVGVSQGLRKASCNWSVWATSAQAKGQVLNLDSGLLSHPVDYDLASKASPQKPPSQTEILIKGIDKQLVGQVAAEIRGFRRAGALQGQGRTVCRRTSSTVKKPRKSRA